MTPPTEDIADLSPTADAVGEVVATDVVDVSLTADVSAAQVQEAGRAPMASPATEPRGDCEPLWLEFEVASAAGDGAEIEASVIGECTP